MVFVLLLRLYCVFIIVCFWFDCVVGDDDVCIFGLVVACFWGVLTLISACWLLYVC